MIVRATAVVVHAPTIPSQQSRHSVRQSNAKPIREGRPMLKVIAMRADITGQFWGHAANELALKPSIALHPHWNPHCWYSKPVLRKWCDRITQMIVDAVILPLDRKSVV